MTITRHAVIVTTNIILLVMVAVLTTIIAVTSLSGRADGTVIPEAPAAPTNSNCITYDGDYSNDTC